MHRLGLKVVTSSDSDKEQSQSHLQDRYSPRSLAPHPSQRYCYFLLIPSQCLCDFPKFFKCQLQQKLSIFSPTFRSLNTESLLGDIYLFTINIKYNHAWGTIAKINMQIKLNIIHTHLWIRNHIINKTFMIVERERDYSCVRKRR